MLNALLNTLAYNPRGTEEGYLFWLSWANHAGATVFATQDAHGPIRHGIVVFGCSTAQLLNTRGEHEPGARNARRPPQRADRRGDLPAAGRGDAVNKAAPSFGRIAAMVIFALSCFGLLLFLWLAFGGPIPLKPQGYRFQVSFAEATQLATEADVRISGVPVGRVKTIEPDTETGRSIVVIELQSRYAPMPSDARAILRQKTLLGETYVELTPGSGDAEPVPDGGELAESQVSPTVQLDEIYRTFDPETRAAFQTWMQEQAKAIGDNGRDVNDALGNLGPFAEDAAELVDILNRQEGALRSFVSNTGIVFEALTERDGQLRSLIENSNRVFQATALARRGAQGDVRRAADVRARVGSDARPARAVRRRHRPAGHPAAAGGARAEPDAARSRRAGAGPRGAVPRAEPPDRRLARRLPGRRAGARGRPAADRPARPDDAPAQADRRLPRAL